MSTLLRIEWYDMEYYVSYQVKQMLLNNWLKSQK